jgi:hypothetical protein
MEEMTITMWKGMRNFCDLIWVLLFVYEVFSKKAYVFKGGFPNWWC